MADEEVAEIKQSIAVLLSYSDHRHSSWRLSQGCLVYWSPCLAYESYFLSLTLSVWMSVTLIQIASSFLFLDGIEPFSGRQFSMWHQALYKTLFLDFWFTPPNAQNLLPKICTKSPISRLVRQIDRRCLGLQGGFRGWPIQWNHAKCCGADPCCHGNKIWARRGDPVAYRLVTPYLQRRQVLLLAAQRWGCICLAQCTTPMQL